MMDIKTALSQLTKWFEDYVKEFASDNQDVQVNIALKKNHTLRVRNVIVDIGNSIYLEEEEMYIAEACEEKAYVDDDDDTESSTRTDITESTNDRHKRVDDMFSRQESDPS